MRRLFWPLFAVLLLAGLGAVYWATRAPVPFAEPAPKNNFLLSEEDRTMGNPDAKVVLIEYGALVCPHCADFDMHGLPLLKAGYIDTGKVFYVFRVFPFRPDDGPAEKLARCMPKEKYFWFVDRLYRTQPQWDGAEYPVSDDHAALVRIARGAGMSGEEAEACMASTTRDAQINRVAQEGEQRYHISGLPTFVIDGVPTPAGEPWAGLRSLLDAEIARGGRSAP